MGAHLTRGRDRRSEYGASRCREAAGSSAKQGGPDRAEETRVIQGASLSRLLQRLFLLGLQGNQSEKPCGRGEPIRGPNLGAGSDGVGLCAGAPPPQLQILDTPAR